MLKLRFPVLAIFILLMAASCAPATTPTPQPIITEDPSTTNVAIVQSIEVQFLESSPVQVNAVIHGQLPDAGCTKIAAVDQSRDGNTFHLTLMTMTDPVALCALALTPFEQVVPLETNGLPTAKYFVNANGIEESFELLPRETSSFNEKLLETLNSRDFDLLRLLMNESFMIAAWRSEGTAYETGPAIEQLRLNYLNLTSPIIADPNKDLNALLQSADPSSIFGTNGNLVGTLFVSGLGPEGKGEGILYVARLSDGSLYWHGLLFAQDGFANPVPTQPADMTVHPTSIKNLTAEQDIDIYSGPGSKFPVIGNLFRGQVAVVTGTSSDESWWHITCTNNTADDCWVSAERNLTRPSGTVQVNQPAPEPNKIPTITILSVVQNGEVTIRTQDFPADTTFFVRMGKNGTGGIDGILVDKFNSKKGGTITVTLDIPDKLHGEKQIAIRLESQTGYFSYNWFDNVTAGNATPNATDPQPTDVDYIIIRNDVEVYSGPGVKYGVIGWLEEGQTIKVTGISVDGKWWQVTCPNGKGNSCWVSTKLKFTRPL
jgi:uncharacterized protein YraI